jgi:pteridine reductase
MSNRVALVTGAGKRRVGAHIADAFADRGYDLAIHYRSSENDANEAIKRYRSMGLNAIAVQADLSADGEASAMVGRVVEHFGRLDVLVNAAAEWSPKKLEDVSAADVRRFFEINAVASFLCAQRAGLVMVNQPEGGCIINIGDWATVRPYLDYAAYFPSKGAVEAMTRSLAVEFGTRNPNVRVNCILPGPVMLPPEMPEDERQSVIAATLVKREGRPENIAQTSLFLVDNQFVTGVAILVDGGRSLFAPTWQ